MKSEIAEAFSQLIKEKNIDKEQLTEIVHSTVMGMIKKKYGTTDNFDVYVSLDKGEIEVHQTKVIVESVTDEVREIDVETARKTEPDLDPGDEFLVIIDPISFGRRLITSAKQNLNQRIRDEEKRAISDEFETRLGEIVMGDIRQISRGDVFVNVDRTEVLLPRKEQIESERYRRGDNVRALVKEVRRTSRGPEIIVSRSDPKFLVRLFELEVPEIYDGIIEIKAVARQPGERSKIAVSSNDKRIDAVGACVGMKGIRIQSVSKELNNEKVDVIPWSYDKEVFITRALSPAKPVRVLVDEPNNRAVAVLPDDQVSLGIGRGGQNRRLTSKLTGVEIEIMKESEYRKMVEEQRGKETPIDEIDGLSQTMLGKLKDAGIETVSDVLKMGEKGLVNIKGIGEKTALKIWSLVNGGETETADAEDEDELELEAEEEPLAEDETEVRPEEVAEDETHGEDEMEGERKVVAEGEPAPQDNAPTESEEVVEDEHAAAGEEPESLVADQDSDEGKPQDEPVPANA